MRSKFYSNLFFPFENYLPYLKSNKKIKERWKL